MGIGGLGGLFGALMGLGGSMVCIPLLTGLARFSQHSANATSLAAVVATSVGASTAHLRAGNVDLMDALPLSLGAVVSVGFGARLASRLDERALRRLMGVFMICIAPLVPLKQPVMEWIEARRADTSADAVPANAAVTATAKAANAASDCPPSSPVPPETSEPLEDASALGRVVDAQRAGLLFVLGTFSGLSAGLLGVGGGAVQVPAIGMATDLSQQQIIGTSLAAMTM